MAVKVIDLDQLERDIKAYLLSKGFSINPDSTPEVYVNHDHNSWMAAVDDIAVQGTMNDCGTEFTHQVLYHFSMYYKE